MRIKYIILTLLYLLFGVNNIYAITAPVLISPSDNATVTSSKLEWQEPSYQLYSTNPYRVQVNNNPSFSPSSSIYRDTYKTTTTYTPVLTYGTWYWRVKAKNSDGIWSDWSSTWSFTLLINSSSPSPTPSPTSTPTPTPTTAPNSNIFVISNTPTQINSDQSFTTSVNLSLSDKPNTNFYIKGAFKHPDKPNNYFGLTKVGEEWIKNSSSSTNQFPIKTDQSGNWSGLLEVKIDPEDSGYLGSGNYIFKVARYDPLIWSNEATIYINNVEIAQESSSNNQTSIEVTANPSPTTTPVLTKSSTTQLKSSTKMASVAGISKNAIPSTSSSSPSAEIKVSPEKQNNPFISTGIIFIISGVGSLGYLILRKNETIYKLFRKRN